MFDKKGQIVIDKEEYERCDELMMQVLDAGAEDFVEEEDSFEVLTDPDDFSAVRLAMEEAGIPMASAEVTMIPQTYVELTDAKDIANIQKLWICWMMTMTFRMYITTGMNKKNSIPPY